MASLRLKIPNFIKPYEAEILINYWNKNERLCSDLSSSHAERNLHMKDISNLQVKEILKYITHKGSFFVDHFFNTKCLPFQDPIICRWKKGHSMNFHVDQNINETEDKILMNYSTLLYLNDNFEGGSLVFKNGEKYTPKAFEIIMFESGPENEHGVETVESGFRYTVPLWYS